MESDEPAFAAPWEASAFALRTYLVENGLLDAGRFAEILGEELAAGHIAADDGRADYVAFVAALERAMVEIAPPDDLAREQAAWREAARQTPHGAQITLPGRRAT